MSWISSVPIIGRPIDSFLNPQEGYKDAAKQMQDAWKQAQSFQQPYASAGANQLPFLNKYREELTNPSQLLNKWMDQYQLSPYAQRSMENAKSAGLDAASSQGLLGSNAATTNIQNSASDIMNKDRQGFLSDLMDKYMKGVGIGGDIYRTGAQTAGNLGQQAIGVGENLGGAAFGEANAPGDIISNIIKAYIASKGGATAKAAA